MKDRRDNPLRKIYNQLLNDEKIIDQKDFAQKLQFDPTSISQMLRGVRRDLAYRLIANLRKTFNVNVDFIFSEGEGAVYLGEAKTTNHDRDEEIKILKAQIEILKQTLNERYDRQQ